MKAYVISSLNMIIFSFLYWYNLQPKLQHILYLAPDINKVLGWGLEAQRGGVGGELGQINSGGV